MSDGNKKQHIDVQNLKLVYDAPDSLEEFLNDLNALNDAEQYPRETKAKELKEFLSCRSFATDAVKICIETKYAHKFHKNLKSVYYKAGREVRQPSNNGMYKKWACCTL